MMPEPSTPPPSSDAPPPSTPDRSGDDPLLALADVPALPPPPSFLEACAGFGIGLSDAETETLGRHLAMTLSVNRAFNLTAVTDPEQAWTRHVFDSLTLLPVIAELGHDSPSIIDVGTGAGYPGIPLAVTTPAARVTLLDATAKKIRFLERVTELLGLTSTTVRHARAEAAGTDRGVRTGTGREGGTREAFDLVVARAVGRTATLAELTVPLAKVGGLIAMIKGDRAEEELNEAKAALHALHTTVAGIIKTPTGTIVVLEKRRTTPRLYPRRDGEPKRRPLGVEAE